jgi:serralysin
MKNANLGRISFLICAIGFLVCGAAVTPARAAFHLWNITEIYTDNTGTLQFIEMFDANNNEQFMSGQSIQVTNLGNTQTNTFAVPSNSGAPTLNHRLLFGTAGIQAAGGPTPDFIIPSNFLFAAGGTITFFGQNSGSYTALPTDGLLSRTWSPASNAANSPTNFAGTTGQIVPEPASMALLAGVAGLGLLKRRRTSR